MTERECDESTLEQRLHDHYQQRYAQPPDPRLMWTRVQLQLTHEEDTWSEQPRQKRWLTGLVKSLVARRKTAFTLKREEETLMESAKQEQNTEHARPLSQKPAPHRRVRHTIEAIAAVILVASLVISWAALSRSHTSQGANTPLLNYTSQPGESVRSLAWTPDGKYLSIALQKVGLDGYRFLTWNSATGEVKQTLNFTLPTDTETNDGGSINISPDGQYVLIVVSASPGKPGMLELANTLTGKTEQIYQVQGNKGNAQTAFSNDNKEVAFIGDDGRIHVWNIAEHKITLIGAPSSLLNNSLLTWSTDDKSLLTENAGAQPPHTIQIWNAHSGQLVENITETPTMWIPVPPGPTGRGSFSPDGQQLLTYDNQTKTIDMRKTSSLQIVHSFPAQILKDGQISPTGYLVSGSLNFPLWLANGKLLFLEHNGTSTIWSVATGQTSKIFSGLDGQSSILELQQRTNGRYAFLEQKNVLQVWDLLTSAKLKTITLQTRPSEVNWLDNGSDLSVLYDLGTANQHAEIYDAFSGKLIASYQGGDQTELSNNGKYLANAYKVLDPKHNNKTIQDSVVQVMAL